MNPTTKILEWSKDQPDWQRDALRRLALERALTEDDLDELLAILKSEHSLEVPEGTVTPIPLSAEHLPDTATHEEEVALTAISGVENAMRLKSGETLEFSPANLTLIYGDNASGKSGYARILKRATRARGQETKILPDVFEENYQDRPPARASIHVAVRREGETDERELDWEDGKPGPDLLARVRVFDKNAAAVYISGRNEVAFVPFNLDLLQLLAGACELLRIRVDAEKTQLEGRCEELSASIPDAGTARTFVDAISANTRPADIIVATKWNAAKDEARMKELAASLTDGAAQALALRGRKTRCESLVRRVRKIETGLSAARAKQLMTLRTDAKEKREAASKLSEEAFKGESLSGVGEGPWRVMWQAARDYSSQAAYREQRFPVVEAEDALCVLCQQVLGAEARDRLSRFRDFMEGEVARLAEEAGATFAQAQKEFDATNTERSDDEVALLEEIEPEDKELAQAVTDFFDAGTKRKEALVQALATGDFSRLVPAPKPQSPAVQNHAQELEQRAKTLVDALEPDERAKLLGEHADLLGRKTLAEHKGTVEKLVKHRAVIEKLQACRTTLRTRPITDAKKAFEKEFLMDPFKRALREELNVLGVDQKVTLGFSGERAVTYQQIQFLGSKFDQLEEVLSEGEHRAVALSCFLAEAQQLPGQPPLVIDDPVSSLDHIRRERVARRLVDEAKKRQVIIFTHELTFYTDVIAKAAEDQVPLRRQSLVRVPEGYGHVDGSGVPWPAKEVNERLHVLEHERLPKLRTLYKASDPTYREQARSFGELLRETWERLIEEGLFGNVVIRFRPSVDTLRLREVAVDDDAWREIHWGMTRTSKWTHDQPAAPGTPPPPPDELKEEIDTLRACHEMIKKARTETDKRRKKLLEPPSA